MEKPAGPALIIWGEQYSVKSTEMDGQHQVVIDLINRLFLAFRIGEEKSQAGSIMHQLADYTLIHFATEEAFLQKLGYTDFVRHKSLHDKMALKTRQFAETFDVNQEASALELMDILKKWWTGHILNEDQKYAALLTS